MMKRLVVIDPEGGSQKFCEMFVPIRKAPRRSLGD